MKTPAPPTPPQAQTKTALARPPETKIPETKAPSPLQIRQSKTRRPLKARSRKKTPRPRH